MRNTDERERAVLEESNANTDLTIAFRRALKRGKMDWSTPGELTVGAGVGVERTAAAGALLPEGWSSPDAALPLRVETIL